MTSCNKSLPKKDVSEKFVRTWFDTVQMMPFSAKLIIKKNKIFEYTSHACQSGSSCEGTWKIEDDTIILKSIKPQGCRYQHRFNICVEFDDTFYENLKTIKDCEPKNKDEDYEIFENEKFFVRNDTLIHAKKVKDLCPNIRIAFSSQQKIKRNVIN